ncbi:MAG: cell division protein FtsI (penicillin-binding protein 3) [Desulforhopalus sp.]|jgi:cell division protein FtsI (penicillin-binding protein 3)
MTKQSRLRVQKKRKNRKLFLYIGLLCVFLYQCEHQYHITTQFRTMVTQAKKKFAENALDRGALYDRNLKQLAVTMERVAVFVRTREIESIADTSASLASILSIDRDKLKGQLEGGVLRLWVAEDISQEQELAIKNLDLPGVHLQKEEKRFYPNGSQAAHLIGYVEDGIGLSGVEFYYDRLLATRKVQQQAEQKPLSNTQDLVLTIDLKIQKILEDLVIAISENEDARKVAAYVIESGTGELIGGAQYPGFDPNSFTKYTQRAIENIFFTPVFLPDAFRIFLRDSAQIYEQVGKNESNLPWSLAVGGRSIGTQLQLWEWLKLGEKSRTDFFATKTSTGKTMKKFKRVGVEGISFGLIPETTTPMGLLAAYSVLLNGVSERSPFMVKRILDIESRQEVLLKGAVVDESFVDTFPHEPLGEVKELFQSMAGREESSSFFLRDDVLLATDASAGLQQFTVNDLVFVTIPTDSHELEMLVVVQRDPKTVEERGKKGQKLEQIIDEKVERISVLQQISATIADVVEPEFSERGNFQGKNVKNPSIDWGKEVKSITSIPGAMPNLVGLSLRKGLRLLDGSPVVINIEGTGQIIKQSPPPGTPLKQDMECHLILNRHEEVNIDKLSEEKPR